MNSPLAYTVGVPMAYEHSQGMPALIMPQTAGYSPVPPVAGGGSFPGLSMPDATGHLYHDGNSGALAAGALHSQQMSQTMQLLPQTTQQLAQTTQPVPDPRLEGQELIIEESIAAKTLLTRAPRPLLAGALHREIYDAASLRFIALGSAAQC